MLMLWVRGVGLVRDVGAGNGAATGLDFEV